MEIAKSRTTLTRFGAILVVIATVARIAATYDVFSETTDEPMHVSSGLQIYEQHRYDFQTVNPPLPRLFIAAGPWLLGVRLPSQTPFPGMMKMLYWGGKYPASLIAARAGNLVFVSGCVAVDANGATRGNRRPAVSHWPRGASTTRPLTSSSSARSAYCTRWASSLNGSVCG